MNTEKIKNLCEYYNIKNYIINDDWTIDVDDHVILNGKQLNSIPLKFGIVYGGFDCYDNQLTSLNGCPHTVHGSFNCSNNQLTSLKGGPIYFQQANSILVSVFFTNEDMLFTEHYFSFSPITNVSVSFLFNIVIW